MQLRKITNKLLSTSYELIFKEKMSLEARKLFLGTSYVAVGTLFGAFLTFVFNVLAARFLGPTGYGNLALVTSISLVLAIPVGLNTMPMVKYASQAKDDSARTTILSTSYIQAAAILMASVAFFVTFSALLAQLFGTSTGLFLFAVAYIVAAAPFNLMTNSLRIIPKMRVYALCAASQSTITVGVFLFFVGNNFISWQAALSSILIANLTIGIILLIYLKRYIKLQFSRLWSKRIINYILAIILGSIAAAFMHFDRILINKFATIADVGLYNAYFLPSMTLAAMCWGIFNTGFFPLASKSRDRYAILLRINKALPFVFLGFVPLLLFVQAIIFVFYGSQYPFVFTTSFFFALASVAYIINLCYSYLIGSEGIRGAKVNSLSSVIALAVLICLDLILIPFFRVSGAATALIFAYSISAFYIYSKRDLLRTN